MNPSLIGPKLPTSNLSVKINSTYFNKFDIIQMPYRCQMQCPAYSEGLLNVQKKTHLPPTVKIRKNRHLCTSCIRISTRKI